MPVDLKKLQKREDEKLQVILRAIYDRAGKACKDGHQTHLRDFEVNL